MKYLDLVVKKIKQELPHAKVFLFGSQANNTARQNSDYDIGILDDKPVPLSVMWKIYVFCEDLPINVDVVDFSQVDEDFKKVVFSQKVIYF